MTSGSGWTTHDASFGPPGWRCTLLLWSRSRVAGAAKPAPPPAFTERAWAADEVGVPHRGSVGVFAADRRARGIGRGERAEPRGLRRVGSGRADAAERRELRRVDEAERMTADRGSARPMPTHPRR